MDSYLADQSNWRALEQLASDGIVGVRIGVARLAGCLFGAYKNNANEPSVPTWMIQMNLHGVLLTSHSW